MANTRVKVPRDVLLKKLQGKRDAEQERYRTAMSKYERELASFVTKLQDEVDDFLALLRDDPRTALSRVEGRYSKSGCIVTLPRPKKPSEPVLDTRKLDAMISVLAVAEDESISIAADDQYARYL